MTAVTLKVCSSWRRYVRAAGLITALFDSAGDALISLDNYSMLWYFRSDDSKHEFHVVTLKKSSLQPLTSSWCKHAPQCLVVWNKLS